MKDCRENSKLESRAYGKLMSRYDDVITGRKWWSHLYMKYLWKVDDNFIAREVLEMIPEDFRGRILDVPVGTAVFTYKKYNRIKDAKILGVDYSREMLAIAGERKSAEGLDNLELEWGDVGNLPYPAGSFDIVLSMNGFQAFPDKARAFAETFRVLKPGGMFCGCFYVKGERPVADFFVKILLDRKGFFRPPHYDLSEATGMLIDIYGDKVRIKNYRSIMIFQCVKP